MVTKTFLFVGLFAAAALLSVIVISNAGASRPSVQDKKAGEHIAIRDALRRGGLREAAKIKGHYVREFDPHWDLHQFDIESLTKSSAVVVVGAPATEVGGRLASEGQLILTDYEVAVQEVIKGEVKSGDTLRISLVGGRVVFEDGTSAELITPEFEHIKVGRTYVFFLSDPEAGASAYSLTGGPQGLVELISSTEVKSYGRPTDPVAKESKDKDKESFLREVRKQAQRWPQPGRCCR
jgi:hypothetical protein